MENVNPQANLDTKEDPHKPHYWRSGIRVNDRILMLVEDHPLEKPVWFQEQAHYYRGPTQQQTPFLSTKSIVKEMRKSLWQKKYIRKKLYTIEGPHNNHTIWDQGCSWTTQGETLFGCNILYNLGFIGHHIFWEIEQVQGFQKNGMKKLNMTKNSKKRKW